MLILAIDCATPVAGVALMQNNRLIREELIDYPRKHSENLMPLIDRTLQDCEHTLDEVDLLACSLGPGSFTGLRVGMATVKGLSRARSIPVVGISTLDMLAENIYYSDALICPLIDARKNQLYTAFYRSDAGEKQRLSDYMAVSPAEMVQKVREMMAAEGFKHTIFLGSGYYPYENYFQEELGKAWSPVPPHLMPIRASALASLAYNRALKGEYDHVASLRPLYVRLSEAEYRLKTEGKK